MNTPEKDRHARRRMSDARVKAKAVSVARINGIDPAKYVRISDHLQTCSGPCCGNRRRYEGRGLDEIRHLDGMRDALKSEI